MLVHLFIVLIAPALTLVLVPIVIARAADFGLVQTANARSSHAGRRASGAGIALALGASLSGLLLALTDDLTLIVPVAAVLGLALVGFADDLFDLPVASRLGAQIVGSLIVVLATAGPGWFDILPAWLALALVLGAALSGALWINLFNFMDGIDGIAASESAFVLVGLMVLCAVAGLPLSGNVLFAGAAALAAIVFLAFNWQPARIFGGDAGAYFHAAAIFLVVLATAGSGRIDIVASLILPAAFLADAAVTLAVRAAHGHRIWQGHRTHAYQHVSRRFGHARTVGLYLVYNVLWLLPLALLVQTGLIWAGLGLLLAYLPAIVFVGRNRAGLPEHA
ncbi:MAG: hypothetical protein H6873_04535 [Hyphomicrobiaceae bacterium]|nr:hypothetical protein [Hyphomicrobiaceae bacterium]